MYKHKFIDYYTEAENRIHIAAKSGMSSESNIGQMKEFISIIKETIMAAPVFNLGHVDKESIFVRGFMQYCKDFENNNTTGVEFIKSYLNPRHLNLPHDILLIEYTCNAYERLQFDVGYQNQPTVSLFTDAQLEELKKTTTTTGVVIIQNTPILPGLQNSSTEKSMMMQVLPAIRAVYEKTELPVAVQLERACSIFVFFPEREDANNRFYLLAPDSSIGYFSDQHRCDMVQQTVLELMTALKFIDILNCKNVGTETVVPKKLSKKQKRRIKNPETVSLMESEYHVIKLLPGKTPTKSDGQTVTGKAVGIPVDIRRGHFKTYTNESPLFGKHTGTYWWQPILRTGKDIVYDVTKTKGV